MAHDVFISHSSKDKVMADAICAGLEARGIRCWIAPRDVQPGVEWTKSIVDAISTCKLFLLVLTDNSNRSLQAVKEVDCALNHERIVLPFRLEDVKPTGSMEYYLSSIHWLDALTPPLESHIDNLAKYIGHIIETPVIMSEENLELQVKPESPLPIREAKKKLTWLWLTIAGVVLAAVVVGGLLLKDKLFAKAEPSEVVSLATQTSAITLTPLLPTETVAATEVVSATPAILTGILTANANCWESANEETTAAKILMAGDEVVILGKSADGNWLNIEFVNDTRQNYCNRSTLVTDCWLKINANIEIGGLTEPLPVFTPRPAALAWWFGEMNCSHATAPFASLGFDNVDYNVLETELLSAVSQYQKDGFTCTYRIFKSCKY